MNIHAAMPALEATVSYTVAFAITAMSALLFSIADTLDPDQRLIAICLAGGIGGGVVAVLMFPLTTARLNAFKFLGSSILTALFVPAICQHFAIEERFTYVLAASGLFGFTCWGVFIIFTPIFQRMAAAAGRWFLGRNLPGADEEGKR